MKVLFLSNNDVCKPLLSWLNEKKDVVYPFDNKIDVGFLSKLDIDYIISYNYKYIIERDVINFAKDMIINLHISLLPFNRGTHPNVWSFLEDTPKGVTIHKVDEGLDTGEILLQKEITDMDERVETFKTSYFRLHAEIQELFMRHWDELRNNEIFSKPQMVGGSYHSRSDLDRYESFIDFDKPIITVKRVLRELRILKKANICSP